MLGALSITGCAAHAILSEVTREEANAFRSRVTNNPGLFVSETADNDQDALWIQIEVAAGILANDKSVEKFKDGAIRAQLVSGEIMNGNYLSYRPRGAEHCTRSWISNLYYFDSRGGYLSREGGVAVLKGDQGTALLCGYGWFGPNCEREGICKAKESKYYKLKF